MLLSYRKKQHRYRYVVAVINPSKSLRFIVVKLKDRNQHLYDET